MSDVNILELANVNKNFDGVQAVLDINLHVKKGEIFSIIGPNGAGKTTLFNLITGVLPLSSGKILLNGMDITNLKSYQISALGVSRTFQNQSLFKSLNCLENMLMGCRNQTRVSFFNVGLGLKRSRKDESRSRERVRELLYRGGLTEKMLWPIGALSLKERKILEMMRAIASEPSVLLLDEPASGLRGREIDGLMNLIHQINREGMTIVMVEHQMNVVMSMSHRVAVLNYGVKISEGSPQQVSKDPVVIRAYLGGDFAEIT